MASPPLSDIESDTPSNSVWGKSLGAGFQRLPHALLKNQARLGLSPLDIVIVLNLGIHWWTSENLPHPTIELIAARIGVSRRSIERRLNEMARRGLVARKTYETNDSGKKIRRFDLSGLVRAVEYYAIRDPVFIERQRRMDVTIAGMASKPSAGSNPVIEGLHVLQTD